MRFFSPRPPVARGSMLPRVREDLKAERKTQTQQPPRSQEPPRILLTSLDASSNHCTSAPSYPFWASLGILLPIKSTSASHPPLPPPSQSLQQPSRLLRVFKRAPSATPTAPKHSPVLT